MQDFNEVREYYKTVVAAIDEQFPYYFDRSYACDNDVDSDYMNARDWAFQQFGVLITSGSEKDVLIAACEDYVCKFCPFEDNNSCYDEVRLYREAEDYEFDQYFAAAYDGFTYKPKATGREIYFSLMEKLECDYCRIMSYAYEDEEDENNYSPDEEETVEECFVEIYGARNAYNLFDNFIAPHEINDLHANNCGWTDNGLVKLIDYSGYQIKRNWEN